MPILKYYARKCAFLKLVSQNASDVRKTKLELTKLFYRRIEKLSIILNVLHMRCFYNAKEININFVNAEDFDNVNLVELFNQTREYHESVNLFISKNVNICFWHLYRNLLLYYAIPVASASKKAAHSRIFLSLFYMTSNLQETKYRKMINQLKKKFNLFSKWIYL